MRLDRGQPLRGKVKETRSTSSSLQFTFHFFLVVYWMQNTLKMLFISSFLFSKAFQSLGSVIHACSVS